MKTAKKSPPITCAKVQVNDDHLVVKSIAEGPISGYLRPLYRQIGRNRDLGRQFNSFTLSKPGDCIRVPRGRIDEKAIKVVVFLTAPEPQETAVKLA